MPNSDATSLTRTERWFATGLSAVLLFTSFWRLSASEWLPDEVLYARAGAGYVSGATPENLEHPPLAKWLFGVGQLVTGDDVLGTRLVAGAAAIAIGALLFLLLRQMFSTRVGVLGLGLWALLPHTGGQTGPVGAVGRLDRFGMLDPVATALALAAVAAGWRWHTRPLGSRASLHWAALTGLLGGLAAGAKPSGVLVLPAIAVVVLWVRRTERLTAVGSVLLAVIASVAGLGVAYSTLGSAAPDAFRTLVEQQSQHAAAGHLVTVAGTATSFPPWWSHFWFHARDEGWLLPTVLYLGAFCAPVLSLRSRRSASAVLYLATITLFLVAAFALTPVKLPFYRYAWLPLVIALFAVFLDHVIERIVAAEGAAKFVSIGVAMAALMPLAVASAGVVAGVAVAAPGGYALVGEQVRAAGLSDARLHLVGRQALMAAYLPDVEFVADPWVAQVAVFEASITSRFPERDVRPQLTDGGWRCATIGGLTVCYPGG